MKLGYARLSSEAQADGQSLELQQERLEKYGCDRVYAEIESGWKGRKGDSGDRLELQRLIGDAKKLKADGWPVEIVFARLDRWARNTLTSMQLIEDLEESGITLRSLDTGVISVATAGKWLEAMQASVFNEYYSRRISSDVKRTYQHKRNTGKPLQHKAPFGWSLSQDRTRLKPDMEPYKDSGMAAWAMARHFIDLYVGGKSFEAVAKEAVRLGLPWSSSTMRRWMLNPIHQGHTWWYKYALKKGQYRNSTNNEREFIYNTHEVLITQADLSRIQQRIKDGKQNWGANASRKINVLQGLCVCATCGCNLKRAVNPTTKNPDYAYVRCFNNKCVGRSFPYHKVEQALIEDIIKQAEVLAKKATAPIDRQKPAELIALESQRAEIIKLLELRESDGLKQALLEIDAQIGSLTKPVKAGVAPQDLQAMIEAIEDPETFEEMSQEERRLIFVALCDRIVVDVSGPKMKNRFIKEIILKF